jgi:molybdopterin molybdotransferase
MELRSAPLNVDHSRDAGHNLRVWKSATLHTVEAAQQLVMENAPAGRVVSLPLSDSLGYTLAEAVRTDIDYPPFDRSLMDGYAVRSCDVQSAPTTLGLAGSVAAGASADRPIGAGEAMQINTGAPIPRGADSVVRLEDTQLAEDGSTVRILTVTKPRHHIAYRGEYARRGQTALEAGRRLEPAQIGVAGSAGAHRVRVYDRPRVAVLSTGDELVGIDQVPLGAQIRNSNSSLLMSLIAQAHGQGHDLGNVRDEKEAIARSVRQGVESDVLCVTGGVSMGRFDLVPDVLEECGVRIMFHKMRAKPGKPTLFGVSERGALVFGLPGNPISAFVGFWLLVRPALAALQGRAGEIPRPLAARLRGQVKPAGDRTNYIPARTELAGGDLTAEPVPWGGSGDPFGMALGDAMIVRPIGAPAGVDGDRVEVLLLGRL